VATLPGLEPAQLGARVRVDGLEDGARSPRGLRWPGGPRGQGVEK